MPEGSSVFYLIKYERKLIANSMAVVPAEAGIHLLMWHCAQTIDGLPPSRERQRKTEDPSGFMHSIHTIYNEVRNLIPRIKHET